MKTIDIYDASLIRTTMAVSDNWPGGPAHATIGNYALIAGGSVATGILNLEGKDNVYAYMYEP